ncbi:hypothetical protein E4U43_000872 [Claviceps pusilla]|uniref:Calcineurin-like phosphoesterase domain-containing protein n=1 Tax=Claviceps pusilla TaxID=123648 RepID=A0A9P7N9H7_9HYPO|nr:hypothetical protein E4U43_000872 [Claviceps pusilla]
MASASQHDQHRAAQHLQHLDIKHQSSIKIRSSRKRQVANALLKTHQANTSAASNPSTPTASTPSTGSVRIVCLSDTHNTRPSVPPGDILIHAGDLTENGSFEEVQSGLRWLSSQPHRHKIFVAGNHDVLFDEAFLEKHPERRYGQERTKEDLDWGSVTYLQDSLVTLEMPAAAKGRHSPQTRGRHAEAAPEDPTDQQPMQPQEDVRSVTIFGSPWTPRYGNSAFQYHPGNAQHWEKIWSSLDKKPQIIVTHGPPHLHLDRRDFHRAGCPYLADEMHRIRPRPRLWVFGHIHASYGREDVTLDDVQRLYEEVSRGWAGWGGILRMANMVLWARVRARREDTKKVVTFVNAAVVGGPRNELQNEPITVDCVL